MELHERLSTGARPAARAASRSPSSRTRSTWRSSASSGRSSSTSRSTPTALRDRVTADVRRHLNDEAGLAREDRERLTAEILDDILGYGPLERLLADDSITEIMVNGAERRLDRARRDALRDDRPLHRRVAPAPHHQQDRRPGRPPHRRVLADGRRAPARRQPRQRDHPAALPLRPAPHDPEVLPKRRLSMEDMVNIGSLSAESVDFLAAASRRS